MQRLKNLFTDDDSAVSPVIGVILMVAITVILAAVIASFVLGLGGNNEPAPQPTIDTESSVDEVTFSQTGGDEFDPSVTTISASFEIENTTSGDTATYELTDQQLDQSDSQTLTGLSGISSPNPGNVEYTVDTSGDAFSAGDSFTVSFSGTDGDMEINDWEVEVVYDPADQDSTIIFDDSS